MAVHVVYVFSVALCTAFGAYLCGYEIGSVNGLQNFVGFLETLGLIDISPNNSINYNSTNGCIPTSLLQNENLIIMGAIFSALSLGGGFGSVLSGKFADYFGRKVVLLVSGVLSAFGGALQGAAFFSWMFVLGRFVSGLGFGAYYMVNPVYIAEIAPKKIRGRLLALMGPLLLLGILTGNVTNYGLSNKLHGWRVSSLLGCGLACFYTIGLTIVPRTPRWLLLKGRESEARNVLRKIVSTKGQKEQVLESIDEEIKDIKQSLSTRERSSPVQICKWRNLKRVLLGVLLRFLSSASGRHMYSYTEALFCSLDILPFVTAIAIGVLSICGSLFTNLFIDKLGRKLMLVAGELIMSLLAGTAGTFVLAFNLEKDENEAISYVVVCLVCLYLLLYSATWYLIPYIVTVEIYPLQGRGIAVSISTAVFWFTSFTFNQVFPYILSTLKSFGALYLLAFFALSAAFYFLLLFPETKGVGLEEIEKLFNKPWLERIGLRCCQCKPDETQAAQSTKDSSQESSVQQQAENRSTLSVDEENSWNNYWEDYRHEDESRQCRKETSV